jgi:TRAP-type C4-dicarboxylate transport system substrate-binding protein
MDTQTFVVWRVENFLYFGSKEVRTLEDIKGLKIRTPGGIVTKVLKKLGATPITMGVPDVYLSMKTGVIDGCITGYSAIVPFKLQEVVNYVLEFSFGGTTDGMIMNKSTWQRLPEDLKPIVQAAGRKGGLRMALMSDGGRTKFKKALADAGAKTYSLSSEEYKRWNKILQAVADEWVAEMKAKELPGEQTLNIYREETRKKGVEFPF